VREREREREIELFTLFFFCFVLFLMYFTDPESTATGNGRLSSGGATIKGLPPETTPFFGSLSKILESWERESGQVTA
jgi:hypothetical protein